MSLPHLSLTDARHLHLAAQGLLKKNTPSGNPGRYSRDYFAHVVTANRYHQYCGAKSLPGAV